jgi:hypothetical protein
MNGGILIQERRCPRCGNRRTARRGCSDHAICFNCRSYWEVPARWSPFDPRTW